MLRDLLRPSFLSSAVGVCAIGLGACSSASFDSQSVPGPDAPDVGTADTAFGDGTVGDDTLVDATLFDTSVVDTGAPPPDSPVFDGAGEVSGGDASTIDVTVIADGAKTCTAAGGCTLSEYCAICTGLTGVCRPLPPAKTTFDPVCGCDGHSYWNPSAAASKLVDFTAGPCPYSTRSKCGGTTAKLCPPGPLYHCVTDSDADTGCGTASGTCWYYPAGADCAGSTIGGKKHLCSDHSCVGFCDAMKSGSYFHAPVCI